MPITRPVTKTTISTTQWGIPITDQVNANTTDIANLKNQIALQQFNFTGSVGAGASVMTDLLICNNVVATYKYQMTIWAVVILGGQAAGTANLDWYRYMDNVQVNNFPVTFPAAQYGMFPILGSWSVNVGQSGGFKFRVTPSTNVWTQSWATWRMERIP